MLSGLAATHYADREVGEAGTGYDGAGQALVFDN
jgi:hypothetical protein